VLIIEEEKEEDEVVPPRPIALTQLTNLIKSFFVDAEDAKNAYAKKENGDDKANDKSDAKAALAILRTQVRNKVKVEVSKYPYNYLQSQCASRKLRGKGSAEVLRTRLENYLIDERFKQQLEAFKKQIKKHKTDADPENNFDDVEETLKTF
jgi:hypothetical protein